MSIISLTYLIFIIIIMFLYFGMPKKFQWTVLLAGSAVFYLSAGISCVGAILATIVSQYLLAAQLDRMNCRLESKLQESGLSRKEKTMLKKAGAAAKKKYVVFSVLINMGLLCFVKYTGVFFEKIHILRADEYPVICLCLMLNKIENTKKNEKGWIFSRAAVFAICHGTTLPYEK